MRPRPLLVANWKMHKTVEETRAFGRELARRLEELAGAGPLPEMVVCPTFPGLWPLSRTMVGTGVAVGAQNLDLGREGAMTGAVSGYLIAEAGAAWVIVGHSERRQHFGETDALVAEKVAAARDVRLTPIVCVGENEDEYRRGETGAVLDRQIGALLDRLSGEMWSELVVAYEPIWAIGTGRVPSPEEADRTAAGIRDRIRDRHGAVADGVRILYGGSVSPKNIEQFWRQPAIDGALVGGASLSVSDFVAMAMVGMNL